MMNDKNDILLIECCNFIDFPAGGQLSFAKNMMNAFGNELILAGITTDDTPVGVWIKKEFDGIVYDFISLAKVTKSNKKPFVPYRISSFFFIKKYRKEIMKSQESTVFIQNPETLLAIQNWSFKNICYRFAGVNNPILNSRYWYGPILSSFFNYFFYKSFKNVDTIFASSNVDEIEIIEKRIQESYPNKKLIQLFTRVNTNIFNKKNKLELRQKYKYSNQQKIVIYTGRLAKIKGWDFLIDCFLKFKIEEPDSIFLLIGDGEDRNQIASYIVDKNARNSIFLLGQLNPVDISEYLNLSDLYVMASYKEGWATSLVEATACSLPSCTTNFSSANEIVKQGVNGYVVNERNINTFVEYMHKSFKLEVNNFDLESYTVFTLKNDILQNINHK